MSHSSYLLEEDGWHLCADSLLCLGVGESVLEASCCKLLRPSKVGCSLLESFIC